jgi:hypothetical protein
VLGPGDLFRRIPRTEWSVGSVCLVGQLVALFSLEVFSHLHAQGESVMSRYALALYLSLGFLNAAISEAQEPDSLEVFFATDMDDKDDDDMVIVTIVSKSNHLDVIGYGESKKGEVWDDRTGHAITVVLSRPIGYQNRLLYDVVISHTNPDRGWNFHVDSIYGNEKFPRSRTGYRSDWLTNPRYWLGKNGRSYGDVLTVPLGF